MRRTYDMLGFRVAIVAENESICSYLDRLYDGFPRTADSDHEYRLDAKSSAHFALHFDDAILGEAPQVAGLVGTLVNHLNRQVATKSEYVMIHAGGVERNGAAVVMPAHMEFGKTTLTTGLVRAGFRYLTDEAVAIKRETGEIVPYPKPMTLDPGSWSLFPELEPRELSGRDHEAYQWQVPPSAIRADAVGSACRTRFVVFPEYEQGRPTALMPMSRAEGLVELAKNTFRFDEEGRRTFDVLAELIRDAEVYRLPNGSLDEAIACIASLFD